jgi:hypothetical protein
MSGKPPTDPPECTEACVEGMARTGRAQCFFSPVEVFHSTAKWFHSHRLKYGSKTNIGSGTFSPPHP